MMYEDRLEAAERRRLDGNALFSAGSITEALAKYNMGLSHLNEDFLMQLEALHLDKANAVRLPILLNVAACHLRLQDYRAAIGCCSQVAPPHCMPLHYQQQGPALISKKLCMCRKHK